MKPLVLEKDRRSFKVARGAYWFGLAECLTLTQSVYSGAERLLLAQSAYESSRMKRSGMEDVLAELQKTGSPFSWSEGA